MHMLVQLLWICTLWYVAVVFHCYFILQKHAEDAGISVDVMLAGQSWQPLSLRGRAREHSGSPREDALSACLLVNDKNARLPEWLAYHYHTLPLRSLIVAADPIGQTSSKPVIDAFSSALGDSDITFWASEEHYMPPYWGLGTCDPSDPQHGCLWQHRQRQQNP